MPRHHSAIVRRTRVVFAAGIIITVARSIAFAEALGGAVRDQSGASVAGAKVVLTEKFKQLPYICETDHNGSFLFPSVLIGSYVLRVEKAGFRALQVDELTVEVGQTAQLTLILTVGDVRTAITVDAPSSVELDSDSNTLGIVVDSRRVQELPLNGREFLQLALLAGGAADISPTNDLYTSNIGPPTREITLPGTLPYSTRYSVNGFDLSGSRDGELAAGLSVAAIDQFKVNEGFLMPEQGASPGLVYVATRTGTNQFHGEAFEFLRNHRLDARSFFAAAPEDLKRNQFGFGLGGPLWRDRIWFHAFYEGIRELTAFQAAGYSPTAEMFGGKFGETGRLIYDPQSYDASSAQRSPFPGAVIPQNRINPVARALQDYDIPGSSLLDRPSNVFGNPRNTRNDDQGGLRMDLGPSQRHRVSLQLFQQDSPVELPRLYPLSGKRYLNGFGMAGLEDTWTISPRLVSVLRAGFLRASAVGGNESTTSLLSAIGITNTFGDRGISAINLQGYSSFGNGTGDIGNRDNTWEIDEQLNYARGSHQIAFGFDFRYRRGWHQNSNGSALGVLTFQPTFSAQLAIQPQGPPAPVPGTGDSFADFLLGMPVTGTLSGLPVVEYRNFELNPYVQDSWRVSRQLTFNYGLSWFMETPPDPQHWARSAVHGFDTASGLLQFSNLGQLDPKVALPDRNNFAPRFGLAWKPAFLNDTVIRAGAGIYYSPMPWILQLFPLALGTPSAVGTGFTNPATVPIPAFRLGQNIFPPAPTNVVTPAYSANVPRGTQVSALDPLFRTAYSSLGNLSIEHRLGRSNSLEAVYLASSSHRLPVLTDLSQCRPLSDLSCPAATRPWPQYGLVYWATSAGNASSDMLIARYRHRSTRGLNFRFEYTLAKTLSDAWESTLLPRAQIAACRACDKGPATFDVRSRAVGSVVWQPAIGRGRLTNGWTISAITTFAAGQPILLTGPNQTGTLFLNHLPNRVCDGRDDRLSGSIRGDGFVWFDRTCFPVPPTGYFGNSGATALYGPGINNWDVGVGKLTHVSESIGLQFRAEFFNAWNHAQFQQPSGNAGDGANFGRISAARRPRLIQFALKLVF